MPDVQPQPTSPAPAPSSSAPASPSPSTSGAPSATASAPSSPPTPPAAAAATSGAAPGVSGAAPGVSGAPTAAAEWTRPEYFPETVKSAADAEAFVREHVAFRAAEESRKLTLPQKAEEYPFKLPDDFQLPQGVEFVLDDKDARIPLLRELALKEGISAEGFQKILGIYASGQVSDKQTIDAAKTAEVQKLGVNGPARKTAVDTFVKAFDPEHGDEVTKFMFSAGQVQFMEKVMAALRGSEGRFSHQFREPPASNGTIPGYATMSFEQRRQAQDALRAKTTTR